MDLAKLRRLAQAHADARIKHIAAEAEFKAADAVMRALVAARDPNGPLVVDPPEHDTWMSTRNEMHKTCAAQGRAYYDLLAFIDTPGLGQTFLDLLPPETP